MKLWINHYLKKSYQKKKQECIILNTTSFHDVCIISQRISIIPKQHNSIKTDVRCCSLERIYILNDLEKVQRQCLFDCYMIYGVLYTRKRNLFVLSLMNEEMPQLICLVLHLNYRPIRNLQRTIDNYSIPIIRKRNHKRKVLLNLLRRMM